MNTYPQVVQRGYVSFHPVVQLNDVETFSRSHPATPSFPIPNTEQLRNSTRLLKKSEISSSDVACPARYVVVVVVVFLVDVRRDVDVVRHALPRRRARRRELPCGRALRHARTATRLVSTNIHDHMRASVMFSSRQACQRFFFFFGLLLSFLLLQTWYFHH